MHALGFDHEQKRGDQAQNVYIHYGWFHFYVICIQKFEFKTIFKEIFHPVFIMHLKLCLRMNGCHLDMDMISLPVRFQHPV